MDYTSKLSSLELERNFLSGLLKFQDIFPEIDNFIKEGDFVNNIHSTIYIVAKRILLEHQSLDKVILAQKIKDLGIKFEIDIFEYVQNLTYSQINKDGALESARELKKLSIKRELYKNAEEEREFILKSGNITISELITKLDGIHNKKINEYTTDENEAVDLYAKLETYIKSLAENPIVESGLITPFSRYNKFFSGHKIGDGCYVFSGRLSEGKSVWLFNLSKGMSILNNCITLYIDSEMSIGLNMIRAGAMEAGINPWLLSTGRWVKNKELAEKVLKSFPEYKKYNNLFYHKYFPNRNIEEIKTLIRKFVYKYVGRGNPANIVFDYLKINEGSQIRQEYQKLGDWVTEFNEIGHNLGVNIILGAQQNRSAIVQNGKRFDDATTIGGSDRILQYARFGAIIRRKSLEEIASHGLKWGSHSLIPVKWSRDQGEFDYNNNSLVKVTDHHTNKVSYEQNFLAYDIKNYKITETGTYNEIINQNSLKKSLDDNKSNDDSIDL